MIHALVIACTVQSHWCEWLEVDPFATRSECAAALGPLAPEARRLADAMAAARGEATRWWMLCGTLDELRRAVPGAYAGEASA